MPKCRSSNFCKNIFCELNSEDTFSNPTDNIFSEDAKSCDYSEMFQDDYPICAENGGSKDILDDGDPGYCAINEKRVDGTWGPWETEATEVTRTTWKKIEKRKYINGAHGGLSLPAENILEWYKWERKPVSFNNAQIKCEEFGGKLFFNFNGTQKQPDFF